MVDSGIIMHLINNEIPWRFLSRKDEATTGGGKKFAIENVLGCFVVLGVGLIMAVFVFAVEVLGRKKISEK